MKILRNPGLSVLFFLFNIVFAQESDFDEWLELDLSELMNVKVTTATKNDQQIEKVPATVRIITAKQINERAYNSLEDVLQDLPDIPVVMCSGYTEERINPSIIKGSRYSFLQKPYSVNSLLEMVKKSIQ